MGLFQTTAQVLEKYEYKYIWNKKKVEYNYKKIQSDKKKTFTNMNINIWTIFFIKYYFKYKYLSQTVPKVLGYKTGYQKRFEFDHLAQGGSTINGATMSFY